MLNYGRALPYIVATIGASGILGYGVLRHVDAPARGMPASTARSTATTALSSPDGPVPPAIQTTIRRGLLTVMPVDVGTARFYATVRASGVLVTDGQVRFRLSMPAQPIFGVTALVASRCHEGYCSQGQLQALGRWHVEAQVCLHAGGHMCSVIPFDLMNGANARFLFAQRPDTRFGPATTTLARMPQSGQVLRVHLRRGLAVRAVVDMPNMLSMGSASYAAQPLVHGWYGVSLAFPMTGVTQVALQVHTQGGWQSVRTLLYDVDSAGNATPITNTP